MSSRLCWTATTTKQLARTSSNSYKNAPCCSRPTALALWRAWMCGRVQLLWI